MFVTFFVLDMTVSHLGTVILTGFVDMLMVIVAL